MAKNIFLDPLNDRELMSSFGVEQENAPLTPQELVALSEQQAMQQPEPVKQEALVPAKTAKITPKQQESDNIQNPDVRQALQALDRRSKDSESQTTPSQLPDTDTTGQKPETELERLERMLSESRSRDRMLKVGGAIGDALATIINARSQMGAKVPGVQVQQGAGLGKVADMFATAPEIQSDVAAKREAMLRQYAELARGQRAQSKIEAQKEIAQGRNKALKEAASIGASRNNQNLDLRKQQYAQLGDAQVEKLATLKSGIDQANMLLPQLEKARKSLGIIGTPLAKVEAKFGKNPEFQKLQQDYASLRNTIRKDIFGATLTPGEAAEFDNELANIGVSDKELGTAIQGLINRTKLKARSRLNTIAETQPLKAETARNAIKTFGLEEQQAPTVDFESKIKKVLKKNPKATRQDVINALIKEEKLPKDYK